MRLCAAHPAVSAMLLALCAGCVPKFQAVDIRSYETGPPLPPASPVGEEDRIVVILTPSDPAAGEGDYAVPVPQASVLAHRLLRSGRFRILDAASSRDAERLAGEWAGQPAWFAGPVILRWGLTDYYVQWRKRTHGTSFTAATVAAAIGLWIVGENSDNPRTGSTLKFAAARLGSHPRSRVERVRHAFKSRIKVVGQLERPGGGGIVASGYGLVDDYLTGEGWDPGEEMQWTFAEGLAGGARSDTTTVVSTNHGSLVAIATDRFADDLIAWADAQYARRGTAPEGTPQ